MTDALALQLAVAAPVVALTVVIHLSGLAGLGRLLRFSAARFRDRAGRVNRLAVLLPIAFGLVALHTLEIWLYAVLFDVVGASRDFEHALVHSLATYVTIGYDEVALAQHWRVLGGIEGVNGVLMLGWSTAFLVAAFERTRNEQDWELTNPSDSIRGE